MMSNNDIGQGDAIPFEQVLSELADGEKPLLNANLAYLSDLSQQQINLLEDVWTGIELKRKRQIMQRLFELAEGDVSLDFDSIFKRRLHDEDAEIRRAAIEGLWENEEISLIEPLTGLMQNDASADVQAAAALALGRFAMLAEHCKLDSGYRQSLSHSLLSVFANGSKEIEVRRRALEAASPISLQKVRQAITDAYRSNNASLKASAIYSMGRNCDPYWLPVLTAELNSRNAELRYEAAVACGELGEEDAVPALSLIHI